jgi:hypothetical protein
MTPQQILSTLLVEMQLCMHRTWNHPPQKFDAFRDLSDAKCRLNKVHRLLHKGVNDNVFRRDRLEVRLIVATGELRA